MAKMAELVSAADHPILFGLVITLVVVFWMAVITWIAKALDVPGLAALMQHP